MRRPEWIGARQPKRSSPFPRILFGEVCDSTTWFTGSLLRWKWVVVLMQASQRRVNTAINGLACPHALPSSATWRLIPTLAAEPQRQVTLTFQWKSCKPRVRWHWQTCLRLLTQRLNPSRLWARGSKQRCAQIKSIPWKKKRRQGRHSTMPRKRRTTDQGWPRYEGRVMG